MDNQTQMEWKDCFKKGNQGARDKHLGPPRPRPGDMALELALPLSPGLSHTHPAQGTAFVELGGAGGVGSKRQAL